MNTEIKSTTRVNRTHRIRGLCCLCNGTSTLRLVQELDGAVRIEKYYQKCWDHKQDTDKELDKIMQKIEIVDSVKENSDGINNDVWEPNHRNSNANRTNRDTSYILRRIKSGNLSKKSKFRVIKH